ATGRFTQEDPIGLAGGMNVYGYADGDPINYHDPFGLSSCANWSAADCRSFTGAAAQAVVAGMQRGSLTVDDIFSDEKSTERNEGPTLEVAMHKSPTWVGCNRQQIMFRHLDKQGNMGEWILKQGKVVRNPKIRGIRVPISVGFYAGTFSSSSYPAPLPAAGQVYCNAGVGTFQAIGWTP
ncbi:MAG: RHS repeat-associated core domain-containing protein, partial [Gemmatimonadaceae bacterium]